MRHRGFTLIELMITVAIVALLARIALPSYAQFVARGKITEALAGLGDYRVKMEQYFQDGRNYGAANGACPVISPTSKYFTFTCIVGNATPSGTFTATASSIAGAVGSGAGEYTYTIDQSNNKATTNFKGVAVNKNCWLIRGSEC